MFIIEGKACKASCGCWNEVPRPRLSRDIIQYLNLSDKWWSGIVNSVLEFSALYESQLPVSML